MEPQPAPPKARRACVILGKHQPHSRHLPGSPTNSGTPHHCLHRQYRVCRWRNRACTGGSDEWRLICPSQPRSGFDTPLSVSDYCSWPQSHSKSPAASTNASSISIGKIMILPSPAAVMMTGSDLDIRNIYKNRFTNDSTGIRLSLLVLIFQKRRTKWVREHAFAEFGLSFGLTSPSGKQSLHPGSRWARS